jgi:hypothetical protein
MAGNFWSAKPAARKKNILSRLVSDVPEFVRAKNGNMIGQRSWISSFFYLSIRFARTNSPILEKRLYKTLRFLCFNSLYRQNKQI